MQFIKKLSFPVLALWISFLATFSSEAAIQIPPKDVVLVLDVSKSMIGLGGAYKANNVFTPVKDILEKTVSNLKVGDTVTLVELGAETKIFPTVEIKDDQSIKDIGTTLEAMKATAEWTYTADMIRTLSGLLKKMEDPKGERVQLAMIFSDAIDDPPPAHANDHFKLGNGSHETAKCAPAKNEGGIRATSKFVYFFSLANKKLSEALANTLYDCFPNVKIEQVLNKDLQLKDALEKARQDALHDLIPAIDLTNVVPTFDYTFKAGEEADISIELNANQSANGRALAVKIQDDPAQSLSLSPNSPITLQKGTNTLLIHVKMPSRPAAEYLRKIELSAPKDQEPFFFLPNNQGELHLAIHGVPYTLTEKFTHLPEFYIPLVLVALALLYALYQLYKYATFRPLLKLYYWEIEPRKSIQQLKKEKESLPKEELIVDILHNLKEGSPLTVEYNPELQKVKYMVDFLKMEENQKLVLTSKDDMSNENAVVLHFETLNKNEDVELTKLSRGRRSRLRIDQASLMKLRNRKFFRGLFLKNRTAFQIGGKDFYVESNLK